MNQSISTISSFEDLKVKYDGTNEIEATILLNSLSSIVKVILEINKELNTGELLEIQISSFEDGSFIVNLRIKAFLQRVVKFAFDKDNLSTAANLITVLAGLYAFISFLKGGDPKEVQKAENIVTVKNQDGEVTVIDNRVYNIFVGNNDVKLNMSNSIAPIQNDPHITAFELQDKNNQTLIKIEKENFQSISGQAEISEPPIERIITKHAILNIEMLSFEPKNKWTFYYEGHKITAKIGDSEFTRLVDSGEKFAKGDKLEAEVEIKQVYDSTIDAYINKTYLLQKIIRHIPRSDSQSKLELK